jgi:diacylglycerol kinase (ATP)
MSDPKEQPQAPPTTIRGVKHIFAAARYSMAGLRCLLRETAFVLEICGAATLFALFFFAGATGGQFLVLGLLGLLTMCVEALNTAIELIVDELSPHRSDFARDAKDIGSFAVFCMLSANVIYAGYVLLSILLSGSG